MNFNFLKDPHTYVLVAMFLVAGWSAISGQVPADIATPISGLLGILAIFLKQNA